MVRSLSFIYSRTWYKSIITCIGLTFTLIWNKNTIFIFDPHSCTIDDSQVPNDQAVPLKFTFIRDVNDFIITFYTKVNETEFLM